ncbi:MAG: hypothetical protein KDI55_14545 [Anaerolineae bacterium]|nr:hypothetical protein [Anaerolineae bacterium]
MSTVGKGLEGIAIAESSISTVDGIASTLMYRGYDVPELSARASFEEIVYLLWYGALPTQSQLDDLKARLASRRKLPDQLLDMIRVTPKDADPIDMLRTMVSALGMFDPLANDGSDEALFQKAATLTARFPSILAAYHRISNGLEPLDPLPELDHAANFLYMYHGKVPDKRTTRALETYLVLLADHEFNASTFAARMITSTLTDMYSAVTGAIGALKGPLHGGAPNGVYDMLVEIGTPDRANDWFENAMATRFRIMGIGHRVYKAMDPRATVLREHARELTLSTGNPVWYAISRQIELLALSHPYFQERKLFTNVDYYSVTVLTSLGFPVEMMTPIFAVSRVAGWTAHVIEQFTNNRLMRPRAEYVGPVNAVWQEIEDRTSGVIYVEDDMGNIKPFEEEE